MSEQSIICRVEQRKDGCYMTYANREKLETPKLLNAEEITKLALIMSWLAE